MQKIGENLVWFGLVRSGLVRSGLVWSGLVWSGPVRSGLVWSGLVWSGLVWFSLVWSVIHRYLGFAMDFFFNFSCISNKHDPHLLRELGQHYQNISDPLQDQLKVGATFQPWFASTIPNLSQGRQLHSGVVNNYISLPFSRENLP